MQPQQGSIVVGVDGTDKDDRALDWAAAEAVSTGAPLHIVWAFALASAGYGYGLAAIDVDELGGEVVSPAAERVRTRHPDLEVTTQIVTDNPSTVLVEQSRQARTLVVGARGLGRIAGRLLGSVSQRVTAHARCPVVVVRADSPADGPVVVGVDPDDVDDNVLEVAFDHARRRGVGVRLIHATRPYAVPIEDATVQRLLADAATERAATLHRLADAWREAQPEVPVHAEAVRAHPIDALTDESTTAGLLVLGSRGRRGPSSLRFGSVALGVLHEAPVVVIVPVRPA